VVNQPVQVEEPLIDDALIDGPLVLEDDRGACFVQPEGVDAAPVLGSRAVCVARKRTPNSVSMFASINRCRETSRATDLPLSSCADPLVMRNSLRSLNSGSQL
jgi:hypothetical protein